MEVSSIATNMHQLKKTILKIPVPIKYLLSATLILNLCGFFNRVYVIRKRDATIALTVTTCNGVKPIAYRLLTNKPIIPHNAAPAAIDSPAIFLLISASPDLCIAYYYQIS